MTMTGRLNRVILFTGHRIDREDRPTPRFPRPRRPNRKRDASSRMRWPRSARTRTAPCWSGQRRVGGDILFHEVCAELDVKTKMLLALPKETFSASSVEPAGGIGSIGTSGWWKS